MTPQEVAALPVERSAAVIVGWRDWCLTPDLELLSPTWGSHVPESNVAQWPGLEAKVALCYQSPLVAYGPCDPAPSTQCLQWPHTPGCGIYAVRYGVWVTPEVGRVVGRVALWGRVVEHEYGWRGQYAYPVQLWIVDGTEAQARDLGLAYGVPCEVWRSS